MKKYLLHIILCTGFIVYCCFQLMAQDSLSVHALIKQIQDQQVRRDAFFMPGIFPSYISDKKVNKEQRKDNNVFYTALIAYTLKTLKPELSVTDQVIIDSIVSRAEKSFAQFKNRKGRESYNFWRTDSAYSVPFIRWAFFTKKNILPDDPDCTSMCLLTLNTPDSVAQKAHAVMQHYVNDTRDPTQTTFSRYRSYAAYSGWLWKTTAVFDVCALSNILTFVQSYNLTWTKADSTSLDLIIATLNNKDHISNPLIAAPYYGGTSVILYHLARLMSIKPIPALEAIKDTLINEALRQLQQTDDDLEKIILSNALLKWNSKAPFPDYSNTNGIKKRDTPFVIANIPSFLNVSFKKVLSTKGIGLFYYYCPAYNDVLLLEYLVLKTRR